MMQRCIGQVKLFVLITELARFCLKMRKKKRFPFQDLVNNRGYDIPMLHLGKR